VKGKGNVAGVLEGNTSGAGLVVFYRFAGEENQASLGGQNLAAAPSTTCLNAGEALDAKIRVSAVSGYDAVCASAQE